MVSHVAFKCAFENLNSLTKLDFNLTVRYMSLYEMIDAMQYVKSIL